MSKLLDMSTYARIDHFNYFRGMPNPFMGVTVNVDVTELVSACRRMETVNRAEAKRRVSAPVSSGAAIASPPVSAASARQSGRSCRTFMATYRTFQPRFAAISAAARAASAGNGGAPRPRRGHCGLYDDRRARGQPGV